MKTLALSLVVVVFAAFSFTLPIVSETLKVDKANSSIVWRGYKVTGKHHGTIQMKTGELKFEKGVLKGGKFEIDMTTIVVDDLSGNSKNKLEGHLKSDDFFSVEKNPVATFETTSVKPGDTSDTYNVTGNLTIKGITNEISFAAKVENTSKPYVTTASIKVDRSKFDVRYGSNSFFDNLGDKAIYDEFDLEVRLVTK